MFDRKRRKKEERKQDIRFSSGWGVYGSGK